MNLEEIQRRLARSRTTASPPESVYKDYAHTVGAAPNEATIVIEASGKLLEEYTGKGYKKAYNQAFTGYPKDVGFNNGLSAPQPDFVEGVEGVEGEEYRPFPIDKHVPGAVLYRDNPHSITLPHIAGEWKGPDGSMREAELQSRFDGAALINARTQALSYMGKSDPPSHAEVTTFTTDGKNISFFAHYAIEAEDSTLEYHQYPIKSTSLVNSHGGHKEGRKELRNAQGYAREQSYALKNQLQEHYKQQRGGLHPVATGVPTLPVPGEPLGAYEVVEHQPAHEPTPSKHRSGKAHSHHSHHSHHSRHSHHSHHTTPHSTKAASSTHGSVASGGQNHKASSSQTSSQALSHSSSGSRHVSKYRDYWKKDAGSGRLYQPPSQRSSACLRPTAPQHTGRTPTSSCVTCRRGCRTGRRTRGIGASRWRRPSRRTDC